MANSSQQLELIRQVCRARRLDEDDTFTITKKLLENYRSALWMHGGIPVTTRIIIQKEEGNEKVKQWYLNLKKLPSKEQFEDAVDSMVFRVCRSEWVIKAINVVMDRVREFHASGELYYDILTRTYFSDEKMTDQEVAEQLALERSTFYRRKKEAILLCGILLWDEVRMMELA